MIYSELDLTTLRAQEIVRNGDRIIKNYDTIYACILLVNCSRSLLPLVENLM